MKLLIDSVNVVSPGGQQLQEEVIGSLVTALKPGWTLTLLTTDAGAAAADSTPVVVRRVPRLGGWRSLYSWHAKGLAQEAERERAAVVYAIGGMLGRRVVARHGAVNSINNMLPFTPEQKRHFPPWSKDRARLEILTRVYVASSLRADAIVVPSRFGLEQLDRYTGGKASAKSVVALNPVPAFARYDAGAPPRHPFNGKPFFFYLSVVFWYKNHLGLIEGYRRALSRQADLPDLLMAGPPAEPAYIARMERAIREGRLSGRARYLGLIPRADIPGLLHHAVANVFPSLCETNSFVQSEILGAHGVMACSNLGPMPEVAGNAADLFDPTDPDAIAATLIRLSQDPARRSELRRRAAVRAAELTRRSCGEAMWVAIERAEAASRSRRTAGGAG